MKISPLLHLLLIAILQFMGPRQVEASTVELLTNANFELGDNGIWKANTLAGAKAAGITKGSFSPLGSYYGYLGNSTSSTGSLFQSFYVPAAAGISTITL